MLSLLYSFAEHLFSGYYPWHVVVFLVEFNVDNLVGIAFTEKCCSAVAVHCEVLGGFTFVYFSVCIVAVHGE